MSARFRKINQILFSAGVVLSVSELWKQRVIHLIQEATGTESYAVWYFPFQLCSTPMYVCLLLPFFLRRHHGGSHAICLLDTYLATYGLLGGIFAFFDTSGFTELGYLPLSVHSYVWHILLIAIGLLAGYALMKEGRSDFPGATVLFCLNCLIAEGLNLFLGRFGIINMFYINPKYRMSQKYFSEIALYLGNDTGILVYLLTIVLGAVTFYLVGLCLSIRLRHP